MPLIIEGQAFWLVGTFLQIAEMAEQGAEADCLPARAEFDHQLRLVAEHEKVPGPLVEVEV
ncbi:hypothetical protein D3C72_2536150 [compost metagenome]